MHKRWRIARFPRFVGAYIVLYMKFTEMANRGVGAGSEHALLAYRSFFRCFILNVTPTQTDISLKAGPYEREPTGAIARAGYFLREVNCCLRVMPFPSSM